jgi:hypothetical protein
MIEVDRGDGYHHVNLDKVKVIEISIHEGLLINLSHKYYSYICQNKIEFLVRV